MKKIKTSILDKMNLPMHIANHMFGENHGHPHRMTIGFFVALFGVWFSKSLSGAVHLEIVHYIADLIGYGIHGVGATPWIDYYIQKQKKRMEPKICLDCAPKETIFENEENKNL